MINSSSFIVPIEDYDYMSYEYINFWKSFKEKCINGYWVSGKYMPPQLFLYINASKIVILNNKNRSIDSPELRDIEWLKSYVYLVAKGFSGFTEDDEYTANYKYKFAPHPTLKFMEPLDLLMKIRNSPKGIPIYDNPAKNIVDLEARGTGKSYWAANLIMHNFIFDGATDYSVYREQIANNKPLSCQTLVGAINEKFSQDLLDKFTTMMQYLPGKTKFKNKGNVIKVESPLSVSYSGTTKSGDFLSSEYKQKEGGSWSVKGSLSQVHHRTFLNKPSAGNGTRPTLVMLEECGFFENLDLSYKSLKDTTEINGNKFGVIMMFGTGGEMGSGKSNAFKRIFNEPEAYDCLSFDNVYKKNSGTLKKIGFFIPSHMKYSEFRDSSGQIDVDRAKDNEKIRRESEARKGSDNYLSYIQNNPEDPEEAFLLPKGSKFPVVDITERLKYLESDITKKHDGQKGELIYSDNGIVWKPDLSDKLTPADYPVYANDKPKGCIVIWEHPVKNLDGGDFPELYVGGCDPYDHDQADHSVSLGSVYIYKRTVIGAGNGNKIVAEFTGRPEKSDDFYEIVFRLCKYYNCKVLHENQTNNIKSYFAHKGALFYLADTPSVLSSSIDLTTSRNRGNKGIHMNLNIKAAIIEKAVNLMLQEVTIVNDEGKEEVKMALHNMISSKPLLKELEAYNDYDNFDRVIAFLLTLLHAEQISYQNVFSPIKTDDWYEGSVLGKFKKKKKTLNNLL